MLLMMIVVMAVMVGSGNGPMGMMTGHQNPVQTEVATSVDIHGGASGHEKTATKPE